MERRCLAIGRLAAEPGSRGKRLSLIIRTARTPAPGWSEGPRRLAPAPRYPLQDGWCGHGLTTRPGTPISRKRIALSRFDSQPVPSTTASSRCAGCGPGSATLPRRFSGAARTTLAGPPVTSASPVARLRCDQAGDRTLCHSSALSPDPERKRSCLSRRGRSILAAKKPVMLNRQHVETSPCSLT